MDILLIAGLWLDGSAWDDVVPTLEALGHRPMPLTLPGQGDGSASATLGDQVAAVLAAVDSSSASRRPTGSPTPTSSSRRTASCPSQAGAHSRGQTLLTLTRRPGAASRLLRSPSPKG